MPLYRITFRDDGAQIRLEARDEASARTRLHELFPADTKAEVTLVPEAVAPPRLTLMH